MTETIPICDNCNCWRDYRDDIESHPDYDGHCWLRGIMTLNVQQCPEFDGEHQPKIELREIKSFDDKPMKREFIMNPWIEWKNRRMTYEDPE